MDPSVGSERREAEDARERVAEGRLEVRWGNYRWSPRGGRGGGGGQPHHGVSVGCGQDGVLGREKRAVRLLLSSSTVRVLDDTKRSTRG